MTPIRTWLSGHLDAVFDIGVGLVIGGAVIGLAVIYRDRDATREPMDMALLSEPEGCPTIASLSDYREHGRGVIGRDAGVKSFPRTMRLYVAADGSWIVGHDPIGDGSHVCIADQGVRFEVLTTGGKG